MRAITIAVGGLLGFAALFMATWVVGLWQNTSSECDGVCFSKVPTIGLLALLIGALGALGGAFLGARAIERWRAHNTDPHQ